MILTDLQNKNCMNSNIIKEKWFVPER